VAKPFDNGQNMERYYRRPPQYHTVPRRHPGVIEYRMVVAEIENINSVNCRIRSNAIYTEKFILYRHNPSSMY